MKVRENSLLLVTLVLVAILSLVALFAGRQIEDLQRKNSGDVLKTIAQTVHRGVITWSEEKQSALRNASKAQSLREVTQELLEQRPPSPRDVNPSINASLQSWFFSRLDSPEIIEYEIVDLELATLFSHNQERTGQAASLLASHPLLPLVHSGQTLISTPNTTHVTQGVVMLGVTPIRNEQARIIALLVVFFDPLQSLDAIFRQGRIGQTGATFAFDAQGRLLIHKHLTPTPPAVEAKVSFAQGNQSGSNVNGYTNYLGKSVIGAWLWDESLNIGIATEIERAEIFADLYKARRLTLLITVTGMTLLLVLFGVYYRSRARLHALSRELVIKQERLSLALQATRDGLWDWSPATGEVYFSPRFLELLGFSAEASKTLPGSRTMDILLSRLHPEDKPDLIDRIVFEASRHQSFCLQSRVRVEGKGYRWFETRGKSVTLSGSNETHRIVGVISDIHERVQATEQLRLLNEQLEEQVNDRTRALHKSHQDLSLILENTAEGIVVIDADANISFANRAAIEMTGFSLQEMQGQSCHRLLQHHHANGALYPEEASQINQALRSGRPKSVNSEIFWRRDGRPFPVEYSITPFRDESEDGAVIPGAVIVFRDIALQKQVALAHQQAREAAEKANRAKSQFLANMSHEIRTPMNAIIGMTQLCLNGELNESQRRYMQNVKIASRSLLNVINDILDFSKIEAGKLQLENAPFSLPELLHDVSTVTGFEAYQKGVRFLVELGAGIPEVIEGDLLRLNQILTNLCSNAVKFTDQGEILLKVQLALLNQNEVVLMFQIRDTGIGMNEDQQAVVFEAFSQADGTTTRRFGGTGLGLSICRRLIEMMSGKITLASEPGKGSLFQFTVSLQACDSHQDSPPLPALRLSTVAVISDHLPTRQNVAHWLMGLEIATRLFDSHEPLPTQAQVDLVLIDVCDLTSGSWHHASIKALADAGMPLMLLLPPGRSVLEDSAIAGLVMPVTSLSRLHAALAQVSGIELAGKMPEAATEAASSHFASHTSPDNLDLSGRHILVVEDNALNQELVIALLADTQAQVTLAENGAKALTWLETHDVDVILMDVQMPVMDGFTATRKLRTLERHANTPVIALTANARPSDRADCLGAGMNDYLSKPLDPATLFAKLDLWVLQLTANDTP